MSPPPDLSLETRQGLPDALRPWLTQRPRQSWDQPDLHPTARFWLQMHDGFRTQQAEIQSLGEAGRVAGTDPLVVHPRLIGFLGGFLQHLDHHHRIETGHYFPQFRAIAPEIEAGLALLDQDHDVVHGRLAQLHAAGLAFHQAAQARAPAARDALLRLADVLEAAAPLLDRHLDDEEEIVIPLIAVRGG